MESIFVGIFAGAAGMIVMTIFIFAFVFAGLLGILVLVQKLKERGENAQLNAYRERTLAAAQRKRQQQDMQQPGVPG